MTDVPPSLPTAPGPGERALLLAVCLTTALVPLNSTMVAVALPDLTRGLGVRPSSGLLLVTTYLVVTAALLPVAGSLGDRLGRRRLVLAGVALFAVSSVAAALAWTLPVLIVLRCLQAAGGALALPNGAALLRDAVPEERRGRAYGMVGAAGAVAAAAGPALGGLLTATAGWRAVFLVNLPLAVVALLVGRRSLPPSPRTGSGRFDAVGSVLLLAGLAGLAGLLLRRPDGPAAVWGTAAVALVWAVFVPHALRSPDPVLDPRLFRSRALAAAALAVAAGNLALYVVLLALPVLLQDRHGLAAAGLLLVPLLGASILLSPVGGRLSDRHGRRLPAVAGLGVFTAALLGLLLLGRLPSAPVLVVALAAAGAGLGLSQAAVQASAVEAVPADAAGRASGAWSTCRYLGSILGSALLAPLLDERSAEQALRPVLLLAVSGAAVATLAAVALPARVAAAEPAAPRR